VIALIAGLPAPVVGVRVSGDGWMIHGEIRVVGMAGEDEARAWITEGLPAA
jgi:hypothetical protein